MKAIHETQSQQEDGTPVYLLSRLLSATGATDRFRRPQAWPVTAGRMLGLWVSGST